MRSHRPSNTNDNRLQPAKNDHHQKKSVFDRLGHQVDSKRRQSTTPQGRFMGPSRAIQAPGSVIPDDGRSRGQFMSRNNMPHNQHLSPIDRRVPNHMESHRSGPPGPQPLTHPGPGPQYHQYPIDMASPRHGQFFQHDGYGPNQLPPIHPHQSGPMGHPDMNNYNQHHRIGLNSNTNSPSMQFRNRRLDFQAPMGQSGPPQMEMNMMHNAPEDMFMQGPRGPMDIHGPPPQSGPLPHEMLPNNGDRNHFMGHPQAPGGPMMMQRWDHPDMMPIHHPIDQFGRPILDHQVAGMSRQIPDGHMMMSEQQHMQQQRLGSMLGPPELQSGRYTKWRERRDVITNLDRETTQSSFRTDSLKSSLYHSGQASNRTDQHTNLNQTKPISNTNQPDNRASMDRSTNRQYASDKQKSSKNNRKPRKKKQSMPKKDDPHTNQSQIQQDMSDGEIVEEESVSDEAEQQDLENDSKCEKLVENHGELAASSELDERPAKRARYANDSRDEDLDYETISDEDLDDFMEDGKKKSSGQSKSVGAKKSDPDRELLVALGLDWGSLVEMAKQNKNTARYKMTSERSALSRFKLSEYLPKLGICKDLIRPEINLMVDKICRT